MAEASRSRPIKRRRTGADIRAIKDAMIVVLKEDHPMTVRQVFYRMVSAGVIGKTEAEYKQTVVRLLGDMRLAREIPFGWIADSTRWMRKPTSHSSLASALERTAETYRRSLWDNQGVHVEVWLEKDALAGVLYEVTRKWDVPLMVTRGYPSLSYLYDSAEVIRGCEKPSHLYYFGDFDPSGVDITRNVEDRLRQFAPGSEIHFERVAVTEEQIASMRLPTRPTKSTDSRSRGFEGESVEVDAIPPRTLRGIVAGCIEKHVDRRALAELNRVEAMEKETLARIIGDFSLYQ